MIAAGLRRDRQRYWIAAGLGVLAVLAEFGSAALGSELIAFLCIWTIIPIASFALGYAEPVRPWRWPIIMATVASFLVWIPALYEDARRAGWPIAFLGPAILGMITAGASSALSRSERARLRSTDPPIDLSE